jgi:hypothetical protein
VRGYQKRRSEEEALLFANPGKNFLFTNNNMNTVPLKRLRFKRKTFHP